MLLSLRASGSADEWEGEEPEAGDALLEGVARLGTNTTATRRGLAFQSPGSSFGSLGSLGRANLEFGNPLSSARRGAGVPLSAAALRASR